MLYDSMENLTKYFLKVSMKMFCKCFFFFIKYFQILTSWLKNITQLFSNCLRNFFLDTYIIFQKIFLQWLGNILMLCGSF